MPTWDEYVNKVDSFTSEAESTNFVRSEINQQIRAVSDLRGGRNVLFYASAWLQKQGLPAATISLQPEELNGFMSGMKGMDWSKGLTLLLHTPGGSPNAAETIGEYLLSKFQRIEVVVPTFAQSAGTMLAMISDRILLGRQSQLGPIDPQLMLGSMPVSALSVQGQFERAKREIVADQRLAHAWAPILQSLGPGLLVESERALKYGQKIVARWLENRHLQGQKDAKKKATLISKSLAAAPTNVNHGQRIDVAEARKLGLTVDLLEDDQNLQEAVLSLYHMVTILFEKSPVTKALFSSSGSWWLKQHNLQLQARPGGQQPAPKPPAPSAPSPA